MLVMLMIWLVCLFGGGESIPTGDGIIARNNLIDPSFGWTITDGL